MNSPSKIKPTPVSREKEMKNIKHGVEEVNCYCRQCSWSCHDLNGVSKARYHCKTTKHTVDFYRESWTELTFNWRNKYE